jgi:hypothetical protein
MAWSSEMNNSQITHSAAIYMQKCMLVLDRTEKIELL